MQSEFFVLRCRCGDGPKNFWLALWVSFLLHLFLLELGSASGRPEVARAAAGIVLRVSLPGAAPESAAAFAQEIVETDATKVGNSDNPVNFVGVDLSAVPREPFSAVGPIRRLRFHPEVPIAISEEPPYIAVSDNPKYFRRAELTRPPELLGEPAINAADEKGSGERKGGKLSLRLFVGASGELDRAEIEGGAPCSTLEENAIADFLPLHFRPGEIDGVAVNSQVVFEFDFDNLAGGSSRSSDQARWWGGG